MNRDNFDNYLFTFALSFMLGVGVVVVRFYDVILFELGVI